MNIKEYNNDPRYWAVWEKMQLLQIEDVSTPRQEKNGTIVWKLPIKNEWNNGSLIEVGSFASGYVRNNNSGYSNYQLNKRCDSEPEFFDSGKKDSIGRPLYTQWTTRTCKLIPIEIDRLEYLISYCLKNYYIKHANFVPNGNYVPKWRYDNLADAARLDYDCGHYDKIRDLEEKLDAMTKARNYYSTKLEEKMMYLQDKLAEINTISNHETI